jgi:hypothetical protein
VGFFYRSARRHLLSGDVPPTITPREYVQLLSDATRMVMSCSPQISDIDRSRAGDAVAISMLIKGLRRQLHHLPADATTNRMLAIAELHAGNCKAAVRHLAIAVNILLAPTSRECLQQSLHARVELSLLLPAVIPLCLRLGRRAPARRLVGAVLARVLGG